MKITDGKRTVEINIMTWNGTGYGPDWAGEWRQITGTYQRMLDAFNARNKLLEFDEVDFFRAYQRTF